MHNRHFTQSEKGEIVADPGAVYAGASQHNSANQSFTKHVIDSSLSCFFNGESKNLLVLQIT
jgi:hypothetical protein